MVREQDDDPRRARPRENDRLVFTSGDKQGEIIGPQDLKAGGPQLFAYPMDPVTKVIRDGSRLNQVMLVQLDPDQLSEATRSHAAQGIVGYSAVCSHTGCDVSEWNSEAGNFLCPCHYSEFDPREQAIVLNGPASRRLAILPLELEGGTLMAAGPFVGRVGFQQQGGFP